MGPRGRITPGRHASSRRRRRRWRPGSSAPRIPETTPTPAPPAPRTGARSSGGSPRSPGTAVPPPRPAERESRGPEPVARVRFRARDAPRTDAPVVGLRRAARASASEPTDAPTMKPGGTSSAPSATGRSSGPRWTPAAPAARATSGRSFTSTGIRSAAISARASATCSRAEAALSRSCTDAGPARLGRERERDQIATADELIVGHQHEANRCGYIRSP